jgi:hypothetical protein
MHKRLFSYFCVTFDQLQPLEIVTGGHNYMFNFYCFHVVWNSLMINQKLNLCEESLTSLPLLGQCPKFSWFSILEVSLQVSYKSLTSLLQVSYKSLTSLLQVSYKIPKSILQVSYKSLSSVL